jgi:hypothetical protein
MFKKSNKTAKRLAILSGFLLLISGISGAGFVKEIELFIANFFGTNYIMALIFTILLIIASFGGVSVIAGGLMLGRNKMILGRIFIQIGSGAGILTLIAQLSLVLFSDNIGITSLISIGGMGVILAVIAPFYAK